MPREENVQADILSKLASTKPGGSNKSLIQETLQTPSIVDSVLVSAIEETLSWITPIMQYLLNGVPPHDPIDAKRIAKETSYYTITQIKHLLCSKKFTRDLVVTILEERLWR